MATTSLSSPEVQTATPDRAMLGFSSLLAGSVLIFIVGFAPLSAVHNAAHDTRHTAAFPCH